MSLSAGHYRIVSLTDNPIGRYFVEDMSLLPKRVVVLPKDSSESPVWQIDQIADGKYKVRTGGSYVGKLPGGHLVAFLLEDMIQDAEWKITHVPQHGENAYIIETADKNAGWVASEEETSQVTVKPLICTMSLPPQYLPTEVFNIVKVPDSDL